MQRLEAEAIRDAMLAVSGRLDRTMEGPERAAAPHRIPGGPRQARAAGRSTAMAGRSIYLAVRRNFLNPMFTAFDYPTPFTTIGRRTVSNVPAQALVMLNNPFVLQQAELWAKRTLAAPNETDAERIRRMYESAFGRPPSESELKLATGLSDRTSPRIWQSGRSTVVDRPGSRALQFQGIHLHRVAGFTARGPGPGERDRRDPPAESGWTISPLARCCHPGRSGPDRHSR